jgi:hypothetical protein
MYKLFKELINEGITPNGFYLMLAIDNQEIAKVDCININIEKRFLQINGYINDKDLTPKGKTILKMLSNKYKIDDSGKLKKITNLTEEDIQNLNKYREMFPKGLLPSGQAARVTIKELEKKMIWFFENYKYDWDIVLKATKKYIDKYSLEGYMYMKTSGYFISKSEKGMVVSTLASYCDMVLDGDDEDKNYNSQDVI